MPRPLTTFVESIKGVFDQAERKHVNKTVALSGFIKLTWIVPLMLYPGLFSVSPYFHAMQGHGTEREWLLCLLAMFALDVLALSHKSHIAQILALWVAGAFLWPVMSSLIASSSPHGLLHAPAAPSAFFYGGFGLWCGCGVVQQCLKMRRDWTQSRAMAARDEIATGTPSRWAYIEAGNLLDAAQDAPQEQSVGRQRHGL